MIPKTVRIWFNGYVDLPNADDRGSIDGWLVKAIAEAIENSDGNDGYGDVYDALKLSWDTSPHASPGWEKHPNDTLVPKTKAIEDELKSWR